MMPINLLGGSDGGKISGAFDVYQPRAVSQPDAGFMELGLDSLDLRGLAEAVSDASSI